MEHILKEIRQLFSSLAQRLSQLFAEAPPGSLQITGVLGLAAVLYGLYYFRVPGRSKCTSRSAQRRGDTSSSEPSSSGIQAPAEPYAGQSRKGEPPDRSTFAGVAAPSKSSSQRGVSWSVRSRLSGVTSVTISAPGVLLEEWTPGELQEAATLREDAATILAEIALVATVYIITQVEDDTGEATCRGALEAGGLVGSKGSQIPPHRLVFCSTLDGKVSIVRQLEPQLHIDGHPKTVAGVQNELPGRYIESDIIHALSWRDVAQDTVNGMITLSVEDLKRFIKLVHIHGPDQPSAGLGSQNVGFAHSLADLFAP